MMAALRVLFVCILGAAWGALNALAQPAMAPTPQAFFEKVPKPGEAKPSTLRNVSACHAHWKRWAPLSGESASIGVPNHYGGPVASMVQQRHWASVTESLLIAEGRSKALEAVLSEADQRVTNAIQEMESLFGFDQAETLALCYASPPGKAPPGWEQTVADDGRALLVELTADTVDETFAAQKGPFILGIAAGWYAQKGAFKDQLRTLARNNTDMPVYYISDEDFGRRSMTYRIMAYPTVLLIEDDKAMAQIIGRKSDADYASWLAEN